MATTKTLMVVDDDPMIRTTLSTILKRAGYRIVTAENGQEAFGILATEPAPDLILLDMLMPVVDGWQFLSRYRRDLPVTNVPIVIVTGTILTREWAAANGCAGFLHKPVTRDQLLAEVQRCLEPSTTSHLSGENS